jgi:Glycosyltransferase family 87
VRRLGIPWITLGCAGSLAVSLAGADLLRDKPVRWFYDPHLPARSVVFYGGIGLLCVAWLAIGRRLAAGPREDSDVRALLITGALWCAPLLLAPSLFSRDLYSYLADGVLLHHGIDPYSHAPDALGAIGQGHVLSAVSPFWRHTTAPYGPAFVGLASLVAGVVSGHLIGGLLLLRGLELLGVILLAVSVPRLARRQGADPARAVWLVVLSPLVTFELVGAGHNDALMAGLLVAGVALAIERRPLLGIAVCALATTIKLPAAVAIVFILVAWARAEPSRAFANLARGVLVAAGVLGVVSLITGLGLDWVSGSLSTPAKVRLAITPSTALGYTIAHAFGVAGSSKGIESALGVVTLALTAGLGAWLLYRVRFERLVWSLGVLLLAAVFGGPAAWPWYGIWGLALLGCVPAAQRWRWLPIVIALSAFLIRVDGQLVLPRETAPVMLALYATALGAWVVHRRRGGWEPPVEPTVPRAPEYAR